MKSLLPFVRLMKSHLGWVVLGSTLGLLTLLSSIGLLALSGWFIAAAALAGVSLASAQAFNYLTPGAGVRAFAMVRTVGRYFERIATHEATFRLLAQLRVWFYQHLEPLNPARLKHYRSSDLLNRIISDINSLDNLYLRVISPTLIAVITSILVAGFLAWVSPMLGLLLLICLCVAGFLIPWLGYRLAAGVGEAQVSATSQLRQRAITYVQGMSELHVYSALDSEHAKFVQEQKTLTDAQLRMSLISGLTSGMMAWVAGIATLLALIVAVNMVQAEVLAPAWLALIMFCVLASFEAVAPLPVAYQFLGKTRASAANLLEIAEQTSDIHFPDGAVEVVHPGVVSFKRVNFAYAERRVLDDFNMNVEAGERVAIMGHTGSGKSSLINILARFWEVQAGEVEVGGVNLRAYPESQLRDQFSVLSQPVQLFAGSVRDNLRLSGEDVSDEDMLDVLERLGLLDMLGSEGLQREVGEGGSKLSGGQRKRLGIARALLRNAPILILDEPTEGLDEATEKQVLEVVLTYRPTQTLLMITHHDLFLDRFDQVVRIGPQ